MGGFKHFLVDQIGSLKDAVAKLCRKYSALQRQSIEGEQSCLDSPRYRQQPSGHIPVEQLSQACAFFARDAEDVDTATIWKELFCPLHGDREHLPWRGRIHMVAVSPQNLTQPFN